MKALVNGYPHRVADTLKLTFANGSTADLDVADGEEALKDLIERKGDYKVGWIKGADNHWLNLAAIVEVELASSRA